MAKNIIGNAPNQVPTNADLGEMAFQDSYWVRVGNITVDYNTTIVGNTTVVGNLIVSSASANVLLNNGSNLVITGGNLIMTTGNISTSGNLVMTTGNINTDGNLVMTTGNINTGGNLNVTGTGNIRTDGVIIAQGTIFSNAAAQSMEANAVVTKNYLDQQILIFGF